MAAVFSQSSDISAVAPQLPISNSPITPKSTFAASKSAFAGSKYVPKRDEATKPLKAVRFSNKVLEMQANKAGKPKFTIKHSTDEQKSAVGKFKRSIVESDPDIVEVKRVATKSAYPIRKESPKNSTENGKALEAREAHQKFLRERAASMNFPTGEAAELNPKFAYDEPTLVIHMCLDCRKASRNLEMNMVDENNQQLVINLCDICRATFKAQRGVKFFQHDLLCIKRRLEAGKC